MQAQHAAFISSGKITFERSVNTFATMPLLLRETRHLTEAQLAIFMQQYRNTTPQFWTDSFDLYFDQSHTFYAPANPDMDFMKTFPIPVAYKNKVYSNLKTNETNSEKQAFEKLFYIDDTLKKIKWKLTEETREIAGYQCRRANALYFDSIYVVAFYTDEILTQGGPESFNGLPGMILGIAIPHQHITIFATRIRGMETSPEKWKIPNAGKNTPVNNKEFIEGTAAMLKQNSLTSTWVQCFINL